MKIENSPHLRPDQSLDISVSSFYEEMGLPRRGCFSRPETVTLGNQVYLTETISHNIASLLERSHGHAVTDCLLHASNSASLQTFTSQCEVSGWLLPASRLCSENFKFDSGEQSSGYSVMENCVFTFPFRTTETVTPDISCFDKRCLPLYANYNVLENNKLFPVIYVIAPDQCLFGETCNLFGSVLPEKPVLHGIAPGQLLGILMPEKYTENFRSVVTAAGFPHIIIDSFN